MPIIDHPVIIEFAGGVGNQLFQYALYQYLKHHTQRTILCDATAVHRDVKRSLIIEQFSIDENIFITNRRELFSLLGCRVHTSLSKIEKIIHKIYPYISPDEAKTFYLIDDDILSKQILSHHNDMYYYAQHIVDIVEQQKTQAVYIRGYWQYTYFYYDNMMQNTLAPRPKNTPQNTLPNKIYTHYIKIQNNKNTCSLHIRRGDYLETNVQSNLPLLSLEYYERAITYILKTHPHIQFYIFSDDPQWCKHHLHIAHNSSIISGEISSNEIEDLILMNACHHHILANSSFSWWGSMMPHIATEIIPDIPTTPNTAADSIIIAPKIWHNNPIHNAHITHDSWILL